MTTTRFDAVWINGSVGTGKTTSAEQIWAELRRRKVPSALIDVDALRHCWPTPDADPFHSKLAQENLRAVSAHCRTAGARIIVAAGVLESIEEVDATRVALGSENILLVRLIATPPTAASRLRHRHEGDMAAAMWHENRHEQLAQILEQAGFSDELVIDTTELTPGEVAQRVVGALLGDCEPRGHLAPGCV